jgi:porphobilinogen deaminase
VGTRLQKLRDQVSIDATILAAAGLERLHFNIRPDGRLLAPPASTLSSKPASPTGVSEPGSTSPLEGLLATLLEPEIMLPCVGQGAIGIEIRAKDERVKPWCDELDHFTTHQCVLAERAFLHGMGGGCQSPVAAYAQVLGHQMRLRAVSFRQQPARRAEACRPLREAVRLGEEIAAALLK